MRRRAILGIGAMLLSSACNGGAPEPAEGFARGEVIGGTTTTSDRAVVLLAAYSLDLSTLELCTATVIGPRALLTSAHCVDAATHPDHGFGLFFGADATAFPTASALVPKLSPVDTIVVHPDYDSDPPFTADLAVVTVASDLGIPPLAVNALALTEDDVGTAARIVGYGQEVYGQVSPVRRTASTTIFGLGPDPDTVAVGDFDRRTCVGDSGGPALVLRDGVDVVIGVDSYTDLTGCLEPAHFRRTDLYVDFLEPYATFDDGGAGGAAGTGGGGGGGATGGGGGPVDETEDDGCSATGRGPKGGLAVIVGLVGLLRAQRRRARARSNSTP